MICDNKDYIGWEGGGWGSCINVIRPLSSSFLFIFHASPIVTYDYFRTNVQIVAYFGPHLPPINVKVSLFLSDCKVTGNSCSCD